MASIISAGTTSGTSLNLSGDTSGVLQLATNGSTTAITVDTSQNVGIGTASPAYALDVRSTAAPAIRLSRSGTAGQIASMVFEDGNAALGSGSTTRIASDSGAMSFSTGGTSGAITGGTERMRITSTGDVGIGTSSPVFGSGSGVEVYRTGIATYRLSSSGAGVEFRNNSGTGELDVRGAFPMVFSTNATERMRIDSSGKILRGKTTSDSASFVQSLSSNTTTLSSNYFWSGLDQGIMLQNSSSTTNAGVGISFWMGANNNASAGILGFQETANSTGALAFFTGGQGVSSTVPERMRITSGGSFLIGKSSASFSTVGFQCDNDGSTLITKTHADSGGAQLYLNRLNVNGAAVLFYKDTSNVGNISVTASATSYNSGSDYRLKDNIQPLTNALEKVAQLKPSTWTWKVDNTYGDGFVAHELAEVCPHAVTGEKDAVNEDGSIRPQGVDTSFLVATLTAAIQELKAELDATKAEVAALKGVN